jgi:hypothetical protein
MSVAVIKVRTARARATVACLGLVVAGTALSSRADATPDFPAAVDAALHLTGSNTVEEAVAPRDGCLLCHTTEAGGDQNLDHFGSEMLRNGAVQYEPGTVAGALQAIAMSDPLAISDIKMGINPNDDPKWLSGATSTDPVPTYGCGSVSPAPPNGFGGAVVLASIAAALIARGTSRRQRV